VRFSYPSRPETEILKGVNMVFEAGKKIAVVGESGSGKSTIVNLILRLYETNSGSISLNDIDKKESDLVYLRRMIGYVPQEPVLFKVSIKENIIFGRENITDQMVKEV
jgi:ABC-type multidrug transport system fused ATPase/permease subunit